MKLDKNYLNNSPLRVSITQGVIDEMVGESGLTILRLPPYPCNLNPIEMVWAEVKEYGLQLVTCEAWKYCIEHTITEESEMYKLDNVVEDMKEEFIITANTGSSSEIPSLSDDSELST
ncbi:hypothetical protein Trydic_g23492 [Trypoxylus dichotomus]